MESMTAAEKKSEYNRRYREKKKLEKMKTKDKEEEHEEQEEMPEEVPEEILEEKQESDDDTESIKTASGDSIHEVMKQVKKSLTPKQQTKQKPKPKPKPKPVKRDDESEEEEEEYIKPVSIKEKYTEEVIDEETFEKIVQAEVRKRLRQEGVNVNPPEKKSSFFFPEILKMMTPFLAPFVLQLGSRWLQDSVKRSTVQQLPPPQQLHTMSGSPQFQGVPSQPSLSLGQFQ